MKLPFSIVLAPLLKPRLGHIGKLCQHPTFSMSVFYTYLYATVGFFISLNHLRKHLGESPIASVVKVDEKDCCGSDLYQNYMLLHDLKIIATSMGIVQYICLIFGCVSENPALFLPHLIGQVVIVSVKILNALLVLAPMNLKSIGQLKHKLPAIAVLVFNWLQEFCVFRRYLCICDL